MDCHPGKASDSVNVLVKAAVSKTFIMGLLADVYSEFILFIFGVLPLFSLDIINNIIIIIVTLMFAVMFMLSCFCGLNLCHVCTQQF